MIPNFLSLSTAMQSCQADDNNEWLCAMKSCSLPAGDSVCWISKPVQLNLVYYQRDSDSVAGLVSQCN